MTPTKTNYRKKSPRIKSNYTSQFGVTEPNLKNSVEMSSSPDLEQRVSSIHNTDLDLAYCS